MDTPKSGQLPYNGQTVCPIPIYHKWKNHFYEMKGDVGMSLHEKERNKKMPTQDTKSLITPSLHLCFALILFVMNALGKANSTTS